MRNRDDSLVEPIKAQRTAVDFVWHEFAHAAPTANGHYLVVQRHADHKARSYRWVRYWSGSAGWYDAKEDKYGPITHWGPLPDAPPVNRPPRRNRFDWA